MGQEVRSTAFTREERQAYRAKMEQNLDVFERMLEESRFDFTRPQMGLEIELNLVDAQGMPALINTAVLGDFGDDEFQSEVGQYNIEMNVPPRPMAGDQPRRLERWLSGELHRAADVARPHGARVVAIGIVPTVQPDIFHGEWVSDGLRYAGLNQSILHERGEDGMELDIEGPSGERVATVFDSIGPLSACTSIQLHQQVTPQDFPAYWNAASAISGIQIAIAANSPYLFGRQLWAETRIPLFTQMTDTRSPQLKFQGVRPRAYFGRAWITSIFDLIEENVRCFPALFHEVTDEDPVAVIRDGGVPELGELRLHNGTVWRWNRPIYENARGVPHLRVENRVLPAGPTPVDMVANACLYYGLLEKLSSSGRPVWTKMPFEHALRNFDDGARRGIDATLYWPGVGRLPATELVSEHLLSLADEGLAGLGLRREVREAYLDIIAKRCERRTNGASWQVAATERFEAAGHDRASALQQMFGLYIEHMEDNVPVHDWPLPEVEPVTVPRPEVTTGA